MKLPQTKLSTLIGILLLIIIAPILVYLAGKTTLLKQTSKSQPTAQTQIHQNTLSKNPAENTPLSLEMQIESTDSGKIRGTLNITNPSNQDYFDLHYDLYLISPDISKTTSTSKGLKVTVTTNGPVVGYLENPLPTIAYNNTQKISFEMPYSSHLTSGLYTVKVGLSGQKFADLESTFTKINLKGDGEYIIPSDCKVIVGDKTYDIQEAPISTPQNKAYGQCSLYNPNSVAVNLAYKTDYAIMHVVNFPDTPKLHQTSNENIALAPQETKTVKFSLPEVTQPQVYEALITLIDANHQDQSVPVFFRWTVPGKSGSITKISFDKNSYNIGDSAKVSVEVFPSMDLYWANNQSSDVPNAGTPISAQLSVNLYGNSGELCGTGKILLPIPDNLQSWGTQVVPVIVNKGCSNLKAEATLTDHGNELAKFSSRAPLLHQNNSSTKNPSIPTVAVLLFLLLPIGVIVFKMKGHKFHLFLLLVGISGTIFLLQNPPLSHAQVHNITLPESTAVDIIRDRLGVYGSGCDAYGDNCSSYYCTTNLRGEVSPAVTTSVSGNTTTVSVNAWINSADHGCDNNFANPHLYIYTDPGGNYNPYPLDFGDPCCWGYESYTATYTFGSALNYAELDFAAGAALSHNRSYSDQPDSEDLRYYDCYTGAGTDPYPEMGVYKWFYTPSTPTGAGAVSTSCTNNIPTANITWTAPNNVTYYNIYRSGTLIASPTTASICSGGNCSYSDNSSSLSPGASYTYTISACYTYGSNTNCSSQSSGATVTASTCDSTPPTINSITLAQACYTPNSGATTSWPGSVSANVTDNKSVSQVFAKIQQNPFSAPAGQCLNLSTGTFSASCTTSDQSCYKSNIGNFGACKTAADIQLSGGISNNYSANIASTVFTSGGTTFSAPNNDYTIQYKAVDGSGNLTDYATRYEFQVENACVAPFIKTQSGDVHSNTKINTPGGP